MSEISQEAIAMANSMKKRNLLDKRLQKYIKSVVQEEVKKALGEVKKETVAKKKATKKAKESE